ncbi:MAG: ABC transporter permease, partial [Actinomycetota bacterium]|nr:ABC transporter permease [Actinomycetota bacterium]
MMLAQSEMVTVAFWTAVLASGVRLSISVGTAAIGEMITERAGVLNLGLEGTMIIGAFAGFATAFETGSVWIGLVGGAVAGGLVGLMFGWLVVILRIDQVVAGLSVTLFGVAFTSFLNTEIYGGTPIPPRVPTPSTLDIPLLEKIPLIGEPLFQQNRVAYVAAVVIIGVALFLRSSYSTLVLDAVGEAPEAADAAGHNVTVTRVVATSVGAAFAGLGGAFLVVGQLGFFNSNITAGRGWVALALVIFGRWKPTWIVVGAVLFGTLDALQFRFQTLDSAVPFEFLIA